MVGRLQGTRSTYTQYIPDWLMVRQQGGVTEVYIINLSVQEAWEHVLTVIREFFHLVGVVFTSVKQPRKSVSNTFTHYYLGASERS